MIKHETQSHSWQKANHILVVRADAIGDVVMTTPALRAIKHSGRDRRLTLLTSHQGSMIAPLIPVVDEVITYTLPWVREYQAHPQPALSKLIDRLQQYHFDAAIICTVYSQNPLPAALMCMMADIPLRLAYSHQKPYQLLTDWIPDPEPAKFVRHEVIRQLDLVKHVGFTTDDQRLFLSYDATAWDRVLTKIRNFALNPSRPWIVVHPGVSEARRQYSVNDLAIAARLIQAQLGMQIIITGSTAEIELADKLLYRLDQNLTLSLAGKTSIEELAALIDRAALVISNNTAPVHLAAAVGTPVVDLYATTNLQHTPWAVPHTVLYFDTDCIACQRGVCTIAHNDLPLVVSPEEIATAAIAMLFEQTPVNRPRYTSAATSASTSTYVTS